MLPLINRHLKKRPCGLTSIHDIGIPIRELEQILDNYSPFLDLAKFGIGTAYIEPYLKEKIELYKQYKVDVYFGGTLFEKFVSHNKFDEYLSYLDSQNVTWIEISNGTIELSIEQRIEFCSQAIQAGFNVLSEVGSKDKQSVMAPSKWVSEINALLDIGCKYVVAEGRDSGTVGLYRENHELRKGLLIDIINAVDVTKIIFEAPNHFAQMLLINEIGANVNLGNINPRDLLLLESQRVGLRSETFYNEKA